MAARSSTSAAKYVGPAKPAAWRADNGAGRLVASGRCRRQRCRRGRQGRLRLRGRSRGGARRCKLRRHAELVLERARLRRVRKARCAVTGGTQYSLSAFFFRKGLGPPRGGCAAFTPLFVRWWTPELLGDGVSQTTAAAAARPPEANAMPVLAVQVQAPPGR